MSAVDVVPSRPLLDPGERFLLDRVSQLLTTNPFDPKWAEALREALGSDLGDGPPDGSPFVWGPLGTAKDRLSDPLARVLGAVGERLRAGRAIAEDEVQPYLQAAIYHLWDRFGARLQEIIDEDGTAVPFYDELARAHEELFERRGFFAWEPALLLSLFYQARRACWFIATNIAGRSRLAGRSRAQIWRAIMGSDACIYARELYQRMDQFPVLITGETGTGKDLAAQCIGWSRYIPFDTHAKRFARKYAEDFHVRNLCEVPAELLEATLFGHKKGAFTGALADAPGLLGLARNNGTLFLDEIGELPPHVQAKLLRPLQNREFVVLGEVRPRKLLGRIVVATHRDLPAMIQRGELRADFYERLNRVRVHMPSLRELRADGGLLDYVDAFVAEQIADPEQRCVLTMRVMRSIQDTLGDHDWPRNLRELKNYTERFLFDGGAQDPESARAGGAPSERAPLAMADPRRALQAPPSVCVPSSGILGARAKAGAVGFEELLKAYVTQIYFLTGLNKSETARLCGFDRRTVSRWIDPDRLARLMAGAR